MTKPSAGFMLLVVVFVGAATFFAWGLATPPLHTAWGTMIDLEAGTRGRLGTKERKALAKVLRRHDGLAASGIISANDSGRVHEKYAYVVRRRAEDPGRIRVTGDARVVVRLGRKKVEGRTHADQPFVWDMPDDGPFPQLVELRFPKKKKTRRAVVVEVVKAP
jgi:hypothetical protein